MGLQLSGVLLSTLNDTLSVRNSKNEEVSQYTKKTDSDIDTTPHEARCCELAKEQSTVRISKLKH
jgi:hypothetical protein